MPHKKAASYAMIWKTVARIPKGKVATYGQIARLSGLPARARFVGYALHNLPPGLDIPWQRVVNVQGRIAFPRGSRSYIKQRELLEHEGVSFHQERIKLEKYQWKHANISDRTK